MDKELNLSREYENLKKEYESVSEYYVSLVDEKENTLYKEKAYLEAKYLSFFGYLLEKRFYFNLKLRKLKKKISIIKAHLNRGEKADMEKIEKMLEEEMLAFYEEFKNFKISIERSREYLESPELTKEEMKEIKTIFRELMKEIHPDIKNQFSEKDKILFQRVLEAYECNNLEVMRALKNVILGQDEIQIEIDSVEELKVKIKNMKEKIEGLIMFLDKVKKEFPFDIEENLKDAVWIENIKKLLKEEIKNLVKELELRKEIIKALKEESEYE